MTKTEVIKLVQNQTENRSTGTLDWDTMFNIRLVRFCQEKRYWWREKVASFSSVAATATYDLTDSSGANIQDLDEIRDIFRGRSYTDITQLVPIFDTTARLACVLDTTQDDPTAYFIQQNTTATVRLSPTPSSVDTYYVYYYAIPSMVDDGIDVIPLVPAQFHHCLTAGLKMDALQAIFGPESPKFALALQEYQDAVEKAEAKPIYTTRKVTELRVRDGAIRSTF